MEKEFHPLLSKETFCKAIRLIQEQRNIYDEVEVALKKVIDGLFLLGVENKYYDALLDVMKEAVNDKYDYITWWLDEAAEDYEVELADGSKKWCLKEPEALYDFIITECQESEMKV